jgi:dolichol-phosphate mannosyltransferase
MHADIQHCVLATFSVERIAYAHECRQIKTRAAYRRITTNGRGLIQKTWRVFLAELIKSFGDGFDMQVDFCLHDLKPPAADSVAQVIGTPFLTSGAVESRPALSIVAPCFNEEAVLREFHRRVHDICWSVVGDSYEILLVDDGSRDATWPIICDIARLDQNVVAIRLSRNHGHQLALTAGLHHCAGKRVLIIDADLQDPPELLPKMLKAMDESGAEVVYGQRRRRKGESVFKRLTARIFYHLLQHLTDVQIPVEAGDFRLMSRRAVIVLNDMPEHYRFIRGMVSWIGMKQLPFVYDRDARFAGKTKYPIARMIRLAIDAITSFSIAPLRFASFMGIMLGLISLALLIYTLGGWAFGRVVEGWTSLSTIILIVSSAQLLVLGCIGEYLGRLYIQAKHRPLFIIDSVVRTDRPSSPRLANDDSGSAIPRSSASASTLQTNGLALGQGANAASAPLSTKCI